MADEEQLTLLKQGVDVWNRWREKNASVDVDLSGSNLKDADLREVMLNWADLTAADLRGADLHWADLREADLTNANLSSANLISADLYGADLTKADLSGTKLNGAHLDALLDQTNLSGALLWNTDLRGAFLRGANFSKAVMIDTIFGNSDLSIAIGLDNVIHEGPSSVSVDAFAQSKGNIPETFLRGCGLNDVDIEYSKLVNPDLSNEEVNKLLYKIYDLRASQPLQVSPLFISYGHADSAFVNKLESNLSRKGIRYWRDIHDMKAGRMEKQIDRAIRQNPTVLLVLSEHSLGSDWVEHEVRIARDWEKETGRDVLCPVTLDNNWKSSRWPKRIMEQIMEYNILDFSEWQNDSKFDQMFRKLIDGLELFYKG